VAILGLGNPVYHRFSGLREILASLERKDREGSYRGQGRLEEGKREKCKDSKIVLRGKIASLKEEGSQRGRNVEQG